MAGGGSISYAPLPRPLGAVFVVDQNIASGIGYFVGLISLLILLVEPKTHVFLRFHAFQWLFMAMLGTALSIAVSIPSIIAMVDSKLTELAYVSMALSMLFLPFGLVMLIARFR